MSHCRAFRDFFRDFLKSEAPVRVGHITIERQDTHGWKASAETAVPQARPQRRLRTHCTEPHGTAQDNPHPRRFHDRSRCGLAQRTAFPHADTVRSYGTRHCTHAIAHATARAIAHPCAGYAAGRRGSMCALHCTRCCVCCGLAAGGHVRPRRWSRPSGPTRGEAHPQLDSHLEPHP